MRGPLGLVAISASSTVALGAYLLLLANESARAERAGYYPSDASFNSPRVRAKRISSWIRQGETITRSLHVFSRWRSGTLHGLTSLTCYSASGFLCGPSQEHWPKVRAFVLIRSTPESQLCAAAPCSIIATVRRHSLCIAWRIARCGCAHSSMTDAQRSDAFRPNQTCRCRPQPSASNRCKRAAAAQAA